MLVLHPGDLGAGVPSRLTPQPQGTVYRTDDFLLLHLVWIGESWRCCREEWKVLIYTINDA